MMDNHEGLKERAEKLVADLKQEYGELRVQAKLAKMEAVDEWHELDAKLKKLEAKAKEMGGATAEASKDVGAAVKLLGQEIRDGFKKVAKRF